MAFFKSMLLLIGGGGLGYYLIQTLSITQRELEEVNINISCNIYYEICFIEKY